MEKAATLFDEMIQRTRPNLFTFNNVIDGFSKKGDSDSALMMYERVLNGGLKPDVVTFTSIIDSHCRTGDLDKNMKLWDEMNKRQLNLRKDVVPSPIIYNPVIDGFFKAGNLDEANAIVAEMGAKGCVHDKMTFTILILGHCMKGRTFKAIDIYKKMLSVGCAPDNITMSSLTSCLRKAGMASEANEIELSASNKTKSVGGATWIELVFYDSVLNFLVHFPRLHQKILCYIISIPSSYVRNEHDNMVLPHCHVSVHSQMLVLRSQI